MSESENKVPQYMSVMTEEGALKVAALTREQVAHVNPDAPMAQVEVWDGMPMAPPHITVKMWWIDPYWYVVTQDGTTRVIGTPEITTDALLAGAAGEQVRIIRLPQYRKEFTAE